MSEKFVASNGIPVIEKDWGLSFTQGVDLGTLTGVSEDQANALREFFQHERDLELGRWRWPENLDYVVYKATAGERVPDARHVTVSNESNGESAWLFEVAPGGVSGGSSWARDAARAYFAAHPEPKPWHDAQEGDVWAVTPFGYSEPMALTVIELDGRPAFTDPVDEMFISVDGDIKSARRIWPEAPNV